MKNIENTQLRKIIKNKRFYSTVEKWGAQTRTYHYRITNVKMSYGKEDPTTTNQNWRTTIVNIVCSAETTSFVMKKRKAGDHRLTCEERIDKRFNPRVKDCKKPYGDWHWALGWGGDPRRPRKEIRYDLLPDEYDTYYANTNQRRSNDLRSFLKLIGIQGDIKIGTVKLTTVQKFKDK